MNGYNFTERVRRALARARQEAGRFGHEYVGTEHVLIGLLRDERSLAYQIVINLGSEPQHLIDQVEAIVKRGHNEYSGPDLPYTSRAKKVIELAMEECVGLQHSWVGTEHILLGLIAEKKGIAAQVLVDAGITIDRARAEVLRIIGDRPTTGDRPKPIDVDGAPVEIIIRHGRQQTRRTFSDIPTAIEFLREQQPPA